MSRQKEPGEIVLSAIDALRSSNPNFEQSYDAYTQQYGKDIVAVNDPISFEEAVDPVILVFGQGCGIYYNESRKELKGSLGTVKLQPASIYIVGRREPQDSKLIVWSPTGNTEVELDEYNSRSGVIPSRVHGAFLTSDEGQVTFSDLCSSGGTVIVGESRQLGPFVRIYDPGVPKFSRIRIDKINTSRKG